MPHCLGHSRSLALGGEDSSWGWWVCPVLPLGTVVSGDAGLGRGVGEEVYIFSKSSWETVIMKNQAYIKKYFCNKIIFQ